MKKNYIYVTYNESDEEIIGANKTVEGTAKRIKEYVEDEYVEDGFSDIEIYLDKLIEELKKNDKNAYGYIFFGEDLTEGIHYQTYIKNPVEEHILRSLTVTKVLLEK